jgi:hypothetical protein
MGLRTVSSSSKSRKERGRRRTATLAYYGPDDKRATKVAVAITDGNGEVNEMRRWYSADQDVRRDALITSEIAAFIKSRGASSTLGVDRILGCPHEEGLDYPRGGACRQCPFWSTDPGAPEDSEH